ncbi:MAG: hypothetical protein HUU37_01530 [Bdellovibrionales bacterium]|nr:hypothetical protein [Bdellovibrionales bacterium]
MRLWLLLLPVVSLADDPEGALRKAEPIQRYRERFLAARPFDASHKSLEHVRFRCELATFAPITYNNQEERLVQDARTQRQKGYVYKSDDFVARKVTATEFHYQSIPENVGRFRSHYEDSAAQKMKKDPTTGQFVSVVRTRSYPGKPGSMASIVEARVTSSGDVLFEISYRIIGGKPDSDARKPLSPAAQAEGSGVFADDYVTCKRTGEMPFGA